MVEAFDYRRMMGMISTLSRLCSRSDEEMMWRVKTHDDHEEFAGLVRRWEEPIRRLCTRMTGDAHRGEDLKQDTFLRLFEKRKGYEPTGRFSTYLWRIALNVCFDELRRQERRRQFVREEFEGGAGEPLEEPAGDEPGPDQLAVQADEGDLVRKALLQVPDINVWHL